VWWGLRLAGLGWALCCLYRGVCGGLVTVRERKSVGGADDRARREEGGERERGRFGWGAVGGGWMETGGWVRNTGEGPVCWGEWVCRGGSCEGGVRNGSGGSRCGGDRPCPIGGWGWGRGPSRGGGGNGGDPVGWPWEKLKSGDGGEVGAGRVGIGWGVLGRPGTIQKESELGWERGVGYNGGSG